MKLCLKTLTVVKTVFIFLWVYTLTVVERVGVIVGNGRYIHVQMYAINTKGGLKLAKYIEKEKIINKCKEHRDFYITAWGSFKVMPDVDKMICDAYATCWSDVVNEPAADVKPVIRAEWILFDKDCCGRAFYCSNCRKVTTTDDFENTPLEREEYFCPRCGADMRGKDNEVYRSGPD